MYRRSDGRQELQSVKTLNEDVLSNLLCLSAPSYPGDGVEKVDLRKDAVEDVGVVLQVVN